MTIAIDPVLSAALVSSGTADNPIIAHKNFGADATITTMSGTETSPASNVASLVTYNFWSATPNASNIARLLFVFPTALSLNFVGIAAHNIGTKSAGIKVQYSLDSGATWINSAAGLVRPTDDQAIGFRFNSVSTDYWRISITDAGASDVVIGVVILSNELQFPTRIYQGYTPPITQTNVDLQSNVSEGGHLLGSSSVRKSSSALAAINYIEPAVIRGAEWKDFQKSFNDGNGFFWAWRPNKYGDLFFAWRSGRAIAPTNSGPNDLMSFEMGMRFYDEP